MDDLGSKISEILSDPQALEQIKGLGDMLGLSNTSLNSNVHKEEKKEDKPINATSGLDMFSTPEALSMISKFAPLLSQLNKEDDTTRLLFALRPFLSLERRKKLDQAEKLIKLMKLLPLVKDFGVIDSLF